MIDPSIVGKEIASVSFPIERSKIAELAKAFGDDDPVWWDQEVAYAAGFDGVPTPPTVTVLMDHWREGGVAGLVDAVGVDLARVLHGEVAWEYLAPVRAGDELLARQTVADVTTRAGKRGGAMTFVKVDTEFTNQRGELVVRRSDTLIEREVSG
jgi:acyl dehydratase